MLIDDKPIGAALSRNLGSPMAPGEAVDRELTAFIEKHHEQRLKTEGERQEEEAWKTSVRVYEEKRRQIARLEWHAFHCGQAERHRRTLRALIAHHEMQAAKLCEGRG